MIFLAGIWLFTIVFAGAIAYEVWMSHSAKTNSRNPYSAFTEAHPHPIYFSFFPLKPEDRKAINNEVVSVTPDGFRGAGPRKNEPTGVLTGASQAFGAYASSDETTISGYLNKLQEKIHFINAAVPSWNSPQVLHRFADQIVPMQPEIVISYGFWNDVAIAYRNAISGYDFPIGSPEGFHELLKIVTDNTQAGWINFRGDRFFPHTRDLLEDLWGKPKKRMTPLTEKHRDNVKEKVKAAVLQYIWNERIMHAVGDSMGFRVVTIIPPMLRTHENVAEEDRKDDSDWWVFKFARDEVMASDFCRQHCLDYSRYFDSRFDPIPVYRNRETRDVRSLIFADKAHLLDLGNEMIARQIARDLRLDEAKASSP